jgi:hypothetical protein
MPTFIHSVLGDQVYLAQAVSGMQFAGSFRVFCPTHAFQYRPQGDDFGPLNLSSIVDFIAALDRQIIDNPGAKIVLSVDEGQRVLTNAIFLLGAYMILKLAMTPAQVAAHFAWMDPRLVAPYRDASFHIPDFGLELID